MNYLLQPIIQIEDSDGNPLVGGKVYVYDHGTQNLAVTYSDFQSHMNTNPIILDSLGHCVIIAEGDKLYDVIIKNAADELQFSISNASVIGGAGEITIENPPVEVKAGNGLNVTKTPLLDGSYRYTVALSADTINHFTNIDNSIQTIEGNITEINNELTEIETDITNISNEVNIIESDVETLKNVSYQMPLRKDGDVVSNNGWNLTVTGDYAWAEGYGTVAGEISSHAEGYNSTASGRISHAEGSDTEASGSCSHAEGSNTTASNQNAHAEGYRTTAEGSASHAEGSNTRAEGSYTHAEGIQTTAIGARSHAGGFSTQATGTESFAHGNSAISNGRASSALGFGVVTNESGALAIGKYNVDEAGHVFQVGIGSLPSERKDAFQIDTNGTIKYLYNNEMVQLKPTTKENPIYLSSYNAPTYYQFVQLDSTAAAPSWLSVPQAQYKSEIDKNATENCYSFTNRSANTMCVIDADFVIKVDEMPSQSSIIAISYGVSRDKINPQCQRICLYDTGMYHIHMTTLERGPDFYFFGTNDSNLVGGGDASIYLLNVTIRSIEGA